VKKLALIVLNNSTVPKLADTAAAQFQAGGWTVTRFGNYTEQTLSTAAYYDPQVSGAEAAALALQQQFPKIRRVLARYSTLPSSPIVVVLTSDYVGG
jgi:hypothetical protein